MIVALTVDLFWAIALKYYGGDQRRFMTSFGDSQPAIGWVVLAGRILLREPIGKWHGFSR